MKQRLPCIQPRATSPRLTLFGASVLAIATAVPVGLILWTLEALMRSG